MASVLLAIAAVIAAVFVVEWVIGLRKQQGATRDDAALAANGAEDPSIIDKGLAELTAFYDKAKAALQSRRATVKIQFEDLREAGRDLATEALQALDDLRSAIDKVAAKAGDNKEIQAIAAKLTPLVSALVKELLLASVTTVLVSDQPETAPATPLAPDPPKTTPAPAPAPAPPAPEVAT